MGCKNTKVPCVHLEKLIQPTGEPRFESVNKYAGNNIDQQYYDSGAGFVIPEGIRNRSYEYQFREKMAKAGLEPVKVDILTLRYVYSMTFKDIADELSVVSTTTAIRLHNESLVSLKKRLK